MCAIDYSFVRLEILIQILILLNWEISVRYIWETIGKTEQYIELYSAEVGFQVVLCILYIVVYIIHTKLTISKFVLALSWLKPQSIWNQQNGAHIP